MKKIYQKPNTEILNIELHQMIATSGEMDPTREITNSSGFASRDFDDWDE